jgi:hypothetical protein
VVEKRPLETEPQPIREPLPPRQVATIKIVADLGQNRGTVAAQQQLQHDRDNRIGIARTEKDIWPQPPHHPRERQDHPECFPAGRWDWWLRRRYEVEVVANIAHHLASRPTQKQWRIDPELTPATNEAQGNALDAPGVETVEEG